MEDLLQKQIHNSCKLALPEGLRELMSDISREVLRAQPTNMLDFITNYLSVLLISREHLSIAGHLCDTVCMSSCYNELEDELRYLDMDEEKAKEVKEIVMEYFNGGIDSKFNLMSRLVKQVGVDEQQMDAVRHALHKAFKRYLVNNTVYYESSSESDLDEVDLAAKHTLKILRKTKVSAEEYKRAVDNVKSSYRVYGVTRDKNTEDSLSELEAMLVAEQQSNKSSTRNLRFDNKNEKPEKEAKRKILTNISSSSLAGSYIDLPKFFPYSVHEPDALQAVAETPERKNSSVDYTKETEMKNADNTEKDEFIQDLVEVEDIAESADVESDGDVELIPEFCKDNNEIGNDENDYHEEI
ncbi:unnamed protein product [Chilo suppressalis]|uniref:RIIa domain-containing protein n=1 Tax=Chilo suppressalis TaxID=168631 RepID=A0ABN8AVP0_CHISP|nr:unnamed protein product [Chilo suppressalis]